MRLESSTNTAHNFVTRCESEAELWLFDNGALSYAPSPFMPIIKIGRSVMAESLCDFSIAEQLPKVSNSSKTKTNAQAQFVASEIMPGKESSSDLAECASTTVMIELANEPDRSFVEACTPRPLMISQKVEKLTTGAKKHQTPHKIAIMVKNPSALKSQGKSIKPISATRDTNEKNIGGTPYLAQENQAIKRQKLESGKSKQILHEKPQNLLHKSKTGLISSNSKLNFSTNKTCKEDRKKPQKKFHPTEPKTPLLQTSLRDLPPRVKSSFEIELEELENAPKFKARPLNKKIFESKGELGMFFNIKKQVTVPQEFYFVTDKRIPHPIGVFDLFDKVRAKLYYIFRSLKSEQERIFRTSKFETIGCEFLIFKFTFQF